jgi:hypothetical protein
MISVDQRAASRYAYYHEHKSVRQIARDLKCSRKTVDKAIDSAEPTPYTRTIPREAPKLAAFHARIDQLLAEQARQPRKPRYTSHKIFEILQQEGYRGSESRVRGYIGEHKRATKRSPVFLPLEFDPGQDAQVDWGEAQVILAGMRRTVQLLYAADPAFALWNARRAEMTALLKQIDDLRKSKSTPLAGFDAVVGQFVARVEDLTALLADYHVGKDIAPRLTEKRLSLAAFLRLMRSRDLAAAGTVLDADWADVYPIAAQVAKLGHYPAWRAEEQAKGLTLGPDYFVLPDPTTPLVDLPEWRATPRERRAWQATLQTRINQQQEVIQALRAVVDAAEEEVLPGLHDLLVATAGDDARGLLIDLAGGAAQRTTRLAQAIETLQGALFAVRVGAFTAGHPAAGWKLALIYSEADFDADWVFWGSYESWQGAMRVFIYPESHLLPTLCPDAPALCTRRRSTCSGWRTPLPVPPPLWPTPSAWIPWSRRCVCTPSRTCASCASGATSPDWTANSRPSSPPGPRSRHGNPRPTGTPPSSRGPRNSARTPPRTRRSRTSCSSSPILGAHRNGLPSTVQQAGRVLWRVGDYRPKATAQSSR